MAFIPDEFRSQLQPFLSGAKSLGRAHLGNESLPEMAETNSGIPWRFLAAPRIHLLLAGRHYFVLLRKGRVEKIELRPGDMWFFPPGAIEHEMFKSDCSYLGMTFHPEFIRIIQVTHWEKRPEDRIRKRKHLHWPEAPPEVLSHQLEVLKEISRMPEDAALIRNAAETFWRLADHWVAATDFAGAAQKLGRKAHASWVKVLHYLHDHSHLPIDRERAAAELGLSPNRIYVLCRKYAQKGFQQLLEEKRIEQAKSHLTNSSLKIETIASLCGYSGAPYFIRAFRRQTGMSPGKWRLNQLSGNSFAERF